VNAGATYASPAHGRVARTPSVRVAQRREVIFSLRIPRQSLDWTGPLVRPLLFIRNPEAVASGPPRRNPVRHRSHSIPRSRGASAFHNGFAKKKGRLFGLFHQFISRIESLNASNMPVLRSWHGFSGCVLRRFLCSAFTRVSKRSGLLLVYRRMTLFECGVRIRTHPSMDFART
jgi:hypothetical protein